MLFKYRVVIILVIISSDVFIVFRLLSNLILKFSFESLFKRVIFSVVCFILGFFGCRV